MFNLLNTLWGMLFSDEVRLKELLVKRRFPVKLINWFVENHKKTEL